MERLPLDYARAAADPWVQRLMAEKGFATVQEVPDRYLLRFSEARPQRQVRRMLGGV